jgi:hypothetical protein
VVCIVFWVISELLKESGGLNSMAEIIHKTFCETAIKYPDKIALIYKSKGRYLKMTYKKLQDSEDAVA